MADFTAPPDTLTAEQQAAAQQQQSLQTAIAAAANYQQTAEQAALLNASFRNNQMPVLPQYGNPVGTYGYNIAADYSKMSQSDRAVAYTQAGNPLQVTYREGFAEYLTPQEYQQRYVMSDAQYEQVKYNIFNNIGAVNQSTLPDDLSRSYGQQAIQQTHEYYMRNPTQNFLDITAQYAQQQNRVIGGNGVMYQGESVKHNPYTGTILEYSASGIAWDVGSTGGGTDTRMNYIADAERVWYNKEYGTNIGPDFIRYATDLYYNRPAFLQEDLTAKTGQHFTNEYWAGGPIRMNLTAAEIAAGGGINEANVGNYLTYNQGSRAFEQVRSPNVLIGLEPGVHTAPGDWGGPIFGNVYGSSGYGGGGANLSKPPEVSNIPLSIRGDSTGEVFSRAGFDVVGGQNAVTINVPYGSYVHEQITNTKLAIDRETGELAIYRYDEKYGTWDLLGGGGRNALQSGMFTVGKAASPYVVTLENIGTYERPGVTKTEYLSRLGAEAYGGVVRDQTWVNLLSPDAAMSRYFGEGANNLANLVNPVAAGKAESPGAKISWSVSPFSPAIQYMNEKGFTGESVDTKGSVFSEYTIRNVQHNVAAASTPSAFESMYNFATMKEVAAPSMAPFAANPPATGSVQVVRSESWLYGVPLVGSIAGQFDALIGLVNTTGLNAATLGEIQVRNFPTSKVPAMAGFADVYLETRVPGTPYSVRPSDIKTGGADWTRNFINNEGKPVGAMWFNVGEPITTVGKPTTTFARDAAGVLYTTTVTPISTSYKREFVDLNAPVTITPYTIKSEKIGESDFMAWQKSLADNAGLPENVSLPVRQLGLDKSPWSYNAVLMDNLVQSGYTHVRNNPAGVAALGVEMYIGGEIFGVAGSVFQSGEVASTALPAGSAWIPIAKTASFANRYVIPVAFGLTIGGDVIGTTTAWGRDYSAEGMGQRGGPKLVDTAVMLGFGGLGYSRAMEGVPDLGVPHWAGDRMPSGGGVWEAGGYHQPGPRGGGGITGGGTDPFENPVYSGHTNVMSKRSIDLTESLDRGDLINNLNLYNKAMGFEYAEEVRVPRSTGGGGSPTPASMRTVNEIFMLEDMSRAPASRVIPEVPVAAKVPWYMTSEVGANGEMLSASRNRLAPEVEGIIAKMPYNDYTNWLMQNPEVVIKGANPYALITARGMSRLDRIYGTGHEYSGEAYRNEGISIEGYDATIDVLKQSVEPGKISVAQFGFGDYWTQVSYSGTPNQPGLPSYSGLPYTGNKMYVTLESIPSFTPAAASGFVGGLQSSGFRGGFKVPTDAVDAFGRFENIVVYERAPSDFGAARQVLADVFGKIGYSLGYGRDTGKLSSNEILAQEVGGILSGKFPARAKSLSAGAQIAGLLPAGESIGFSLVGQPYSVPGIFHSTKGRLLLTEQSLSMTLGEANAILPDILKISGEPSRKLPPLTLGQFTERVSMYTAEGFDVINAVMRGQEDILLSKWSPEYQSEGKAYLSSAKNAARSLIIGTKYFGDVLPTGTTLFRGVNIDRMRRFAGESPEDITAISTAKNIVGLPYQDASFQSFTLSTQVAGKFAGKKGYPVVLKYVTKEPLRVIRGEATESEYILLPETFEVAGFEETMPETFTYGVTDTRNSTSSIMRVVDIKPASQQVGFTLVGKPYSIEDFQSRKFNDTIGFENLDLMYAQRYGGIADLNQKLLPAAGQTSTIWNSPIDIETNINWLKFREQPVLEKFDTVKKDLKWKPLEFNQNQLNAMQFENRQTLTTLGEYRELQLTDLFVREDREIGAYFGAEPGIEGVLIGWNIGKPSKKGHLSVSFSAMDPDVRGFVKEYYEKYSAPLFYSSGVPWAPQFKYNTIITGTSLHTHPPTWEKGDISAGYHSGRDVMLVASDFMRARRERTPIKFARQDVGFVGFDKPMLYETSVVEAVMMKAIVERGEPQSLSRSINVAFGKRRNAFSNEVIKPAGLQKHGTEWMAGVINLHRRTQVEYGWPTEIKALSETPGVFRIDEAGELKLIKPKMEEGFQKPKYSGDIAPPIVTFEGVTWNTGKSDFADARYWIERMEEIPPSQREYQPVLHWLPTNEILTRQYEMFGSRTAAYSLKDYTKVSHEFLIEKGKELFYGTFFDADRVASIADTMLAGNEFNALTIFYDRFGKPDWETQEGRHRTQALANLKISHAPVWELFQSDLGRDERAGYFLRPESKQVMNRVPAYRIGEIPEFGFKKPGYSGDILKKTPEETIAEIMLGTRNANPKREIAVIFDAKMKPFASVLGEHNTVPAESVGVARDAVMWRGESPYDYTMIHTHPIGGSNYPSFADISTAANIGRFQGFGKHGVATSDAILMYSFRTPRELYTSGKNEPTAVEKSMEYLNYAFREGGGEKSHARAWFELQWMGGVDTSAIMYPKPKASDVMRFEKPGYSGEIQKYITLSDVSKESNWGEFQYTHKKERSLLKGVIEDRSIIPDTLYHVTTNLPAVLESGVLRHMPGGVGLGKGTSVAHHGVSLTSSLEDALLIQREVIRTVDVAQGRDFSTALDEYIREDQEIIGAKINLSTANLREDVIENYNFRMGREEHYNNPFWKEDAGIESLLDYRVSRDSVTKGKLQDPIIFGRADVFSKIPEENIGIVTVRKSDIPSDVLLRDPISGFMHEVMVHSDVAIAGEFEKTYPLNAPLHEVTIGGYTIEHVSTRNPLFGARHDGWTSIQGKQLYEEVRSTRFQNDVARDFAQRAVLKGREGLIIARTPEGGLAGVANFYYRDSGNYLNPEYMATVERGKGAGSAMVEYLEQFAGKIGKKGLVGEPYPSAESYWAMKGWTPEGERGGLWKKDLGFKKSSYTGEITQRPATEAEILEMIRPTKRVATEAEIKAYIQAKRQDILWDETFRKPEYHGSLKHVNKPATVVDIVPGYAKWDYGRADIPIFDSYIEGSSVGRSGVGVDATLQWMTPTEFINTEKAIMGAREVRQDEFIIGSKGIEVFSRTGKKIPVENFGDFRFNRGISEEKLKSVTEAMQSPINTFSAFAVERDRFGTLKDYQEGRHRAVAAHYLGIKKVPVWTFQDTIANRLSGYDWEKTGRMSRMEAMDYIQERYPTQQEIWYRYMHETQQMSLKDGGFKKQSYAGDILFTGRYEGISREASARQLETMRGISDVLVPGEKEALFLFDRTSGEMVAKGIGRTSSTIEMGSVYKAYESIPEASRGNLAFYHTHPWTEAVGGILKPEAVEYMGSRKSYPSVNDILNIGSSYPFTKSAMFAEEGIIAPARHITSWRGMKRPDYPDALFRPVSPEALDKIYLASHEPRRFQIEMARVGLDTQIIIGDTKDVHLSTLSDTPQRTFFRIPKDVVYAPLPRDYRQEVTDAFRSPSYAYKTKIQTLAGDFQRVATGTERARYDTLFKKYYSTASEPGGALSAGEMIEFDRLNHVVDEHRFEQKFPKPSEGFVDAVLSLRQYTLATGNEGIFTYDLTRDTDAATLHDGYPWAVFKTQSAIESYWSELMQYHEMHPKSEMAMVHPHPSGSPELSMNDVYAAGSYYLNANVMYQGILTASKSFSTLGIYKAPIEVRGTYIGPMDMGQPLVKPSVLFEIQPSLDSRGMFTRKTQPVEDAFRKPRYAGEVTWGTELKEPLRPKSLADLNDFVEMNRGYTPSEFSAIQTYTNPNASTGFQMNAIVYADVNVDFAADISGRLAPGLDEKIPALESAFARQVSPSLRENEFFYRGINLEKTAVTSGIELQPGNVPSIGDELLMRGFVSTTLSPARAVGYSQYYDYVDNISRTASRVLPVVAIRAPAETPIIYSKNQMEVILQKHSVFEVSKSYVKPYSNLIDALPGSQARLTKKDAAFVDYQYLYGKNNVLVIEAEYKGVSEARHRSVWEDSLSFRKPSAPSGLLSGRDLPTVPQVPQMPERYDYLKKPQHIEQFLREGTTPEAGEVERFAVLNKFGDVITSGTGEVNGISTRMIDDYFTPGATRGKVFAHSHGLGRKPSPMDILNKYPSSADTRLFIQYGAKRSEIYWQGGVTTVELPDRLVLGAEGKETSIADLVRNSEEARRIEEKYELSVSTRMGRLGYKEWDEIPTEVWDAQFADMFTSLERQTGIKVRFSPYDEMAGVASEVVPGAKDLMKGQYGGGDAFRKAYYPLERYEGENPKLAAEFERIRTGSDLLPGSVETLYITNLQTGKIAFRYQGELGHVDSKPAVDFLKAQPLGGRWGIAHSHVPRLYGSLHPAIKSLEVATFGAELALRGDIGMSAYLRDLPGRLARNYRGVTDTMRQEVESTPSPADILTAHGNSLKGLNVFEESVISQYGVSVYKKGGVVRPLEEIYGDRVAETYERYGYPIRQSELVNNYYAPGYKGGFRKPEYSGSIGESVEDVLSLEKAYQRRNSKPREFFPPAVIPFERVITGRAYDITRTNAVYENDLQRIVMESNRDVVQVDKFGTVNARKHTDSLVIDAEQYAMTSGEDLMPKLSASTAYLDVFRVETQMDLYPSGAKITSVVGRRAIATVPASAATGAISSRGIAYGQRSIELNLMEVGDNILKSATHSTKPEDMLVRLSPEDVPSIVRDLATTYNNAISDLTGSTNVASGTTRIVRSDVALEDVFAKDMLGVNFPGTRGKSLGAEFSAGDYSKLFIREGKYAGAMIEPRGARVSSLFKSLPEYGAVGTEIISSFNGTPLPPITAGDYMFDISGAMKESLFGKEAQVFEVEAQRLREQTGTERVTLPYDKSRKGITQLMDTFGRNKKVSPISHESNGPVKAISAIADTFAQDRTEQIGKGINTVLKKAKQSAKQREPVNESPPQILSLYPQNLQGPSRASDIDYPHGPSPIHRRHGVIQFEDESHVPSQEALRRTGIASRFGFKEPYRGHAESVSLSATQASAEKNAQRFASITLPRILLGQDRKQEQKQENKSVLILGNITELMAIQTEKMDQMGLLGQRDTFSKEFAMLRAPEIDLMSRSRQGVIQEIGLDIGLRPWQEFRTMTEQVVKQDQIQRQITQQITEQITITDQITGGHWIRGWETPDIPKIPPLGGLGMGGGGGGGVGWYQRTSKYNYKNPVVDIPYLESLYGRFGEIGQKHGNIKHKSKR